MKLLSRGLLVLLGICHAHAAMTGGSPIDRSLLPKNGGSMTKVRDAALSNDLPDLRGGASKGKTSSKGSSGILKAAFSPRVALKVVGLGTLSFSIPALATPDAFHAAFLNATPPTDLSSVYRILFAIRELLLTAMALFISASGSDDLCRNCLTVFNLALSPAQIALFITSTAITPESRSFLVSFQIIIGLYLATTNILAWKAKASKGKK